MERYRIGGKVTKYEQLCWSCANACGGCSWARDFIPVKGWEAEKTIVPSDKTETYEILLCPQYKFDKREVTQKELAIKTGINIKKILLTPIEVLREKANFTKAVLQRYGEIFVLEALTPQNADTCVCCGAVIPEGTQVCINCIKSVDK
jgi:hypothetical protein